MHGPHLHSRCYLESGAPPPLPPPRLKSQMPNAPSPVAPARGSTASASLRTSTMPSPGGDAAVQMRTKPALPPKPGSKPSIYLPAKPVTVSSFAQTDPLRELPPIGAKPSPPSPPLSTDRPDAPDRSASLRSGAICSFLISVHVIRCVYS